MDDITRAHYEGKFKVAFLEARGNAFQTLFEQLTEKAHPADFIPCRPWGSAGDRKNDGYLPSERTLFQVYAPNEMSAADAIAKIDGDFIGALPHWAQYFDKWVFVHNAHDGLAPQIIAKLLELEREHWPLKLTHWSLEELRQRLQRIPLDGLQSLFGYAPTEIGETTKPLIAAVASQQATIEAQRLQNEELHRQLAELRRVSADQQLAASGQQVATGGKAHWSVELQEHIHAQARTIIDRASRSTDPVVLRRAYLLRRDLKKAELFHAQVNAIRQAHPTVDLILRAEEEFDDTMFEGDLLCGLGRPAGAIACYEKAYALRPTNRDVAVALAVTLVCVGNPMAGDATSWATGKDNQKANTLRAKGIFESLLGQVISDRDPNDSRYLHGIALCWVQLAHLGVGDARTEAKKYLDRVIQLDDLSRGYALMLMTVILEMDGQLAEAESYWKQLVALYPNGVPARFMYGRFLAELPGREGEAEAIYKECLTLNPNEPDVLSGYAFLLAFQPGREAEAEDYFQRAIRAWPEHDTALRNYAVFLSVQPGREADAEEAYKRASDTRPTDPSIAISYLKFLCRQEGRAADVSKWAEKAAELAPSGAESQYIYGQVLSQTDGRQKDAEDTFKRVLILNERHHGALFQMGVLLAAGDGREAEAESYFKRALEIDARGEATLRNYGQFLATWAGREAEAEALFQRCIDIAGEEPRALHSYASLLAGQNGRQTEAESLCRRALAVNPSQAGTMAILVALLVQDPSRKEEAEEACKQVLQARPNDWRILYNYAKLISQVPERDGGTRFAE